MYGDSGVMRRRAAQLREQGTDLRTMADHLVSRTEEIAWDGRAADAMRERIRQRAVHLRASAADHDTAAETLERHAQEVDALKEAIQAIERRATALVEDARTRVARLDGAPGPDDVRREPAPTDRVLATFDPPPPGHKDWLGVSLPGL
jgi:hypothetical protein